MIGVGKVKSRSMRMDGGEVLGGKERRSRPIGEQRRGTEGKGQSGGKRELRGEVDEPDICPLK